MKVAAAIRFKISEDISIEGAYEIAKNMFGKEPDDIDKWDDQVDYFYYNPANNDGFTVNVPDNIMYVDYMFDLDGYGFDLNINQNELNMILSKFYWKFNKMFDWKLKVFYFYDGGCAGLAEVA